MRARLLVVTALVSFTSLTAYADAGKAWTTAKANLPSDTAVVIGANISAITKSSLFAQITPVLFQKKPDVKASLEDMKRLCKLDPMTVIQGLVVAMDADQTHGAVFASVTGLDQTKLAACYQAVAKDKGTPDVAIKRDGNVVEVTADKTKKYYGWVGSDVLVFAINGNDRAELEKWMGGKGAFAKSAVAKIAAKATTSAAIWAASAIERPLDDTLKVKQGYVSIKFATGSVALELHGSMGSAKDATAAATKVNKQVDDVKGLMEGLAPLFKALTVTPVADEVVIKLSATEKDLAPLIAMLGMI